MPEDCRPPPPEATYGNVDTPNGPSPVANATYSNVSETPPNLPSPTSKTGTFNVLQQVSFQYPPRREKKKEKKKRKEKKEKEKKKERRERGGGGRGRGGGEGERERESGREREGGRESARERGRSMC